MTEVLSRQNYVCFNNKVVATKICLSQQNLSQVYTFVATKDVLSRQTHVCHDKTFVLTKMILVAAPAKDTYALN